MKDKDGYTRSVDSWASVHRLTRRRGACGNLYNCNQTRVMHHASSVLLCFFLLFWWPTFASLFIRCTVFGDPKVVCVRRATTAEEVEKVILALRNTTGRKVKPLNKPVVSRLPSVQVSVTGCSCVALQHTPLPLPNVCRCNHGAGPVGS